MNEKFISKAPGGIRLELSWLLLALIIIPVFTFMNGFYNAVNVESEERYYWDVSFLGEPADRHGDLVKGALSLYSGPALDISDWSPHYQAFYLHNAYGQIKDVPQGRISLYSLPPLTLLLVSGVLQEMLVLGPSGVVATHYVMAWALIWMLCWYFIAVRREQIIAFVSLALGYPFLIVLSSGNFPSLFVAISLMGFIYLSCSQKHVVVAVILLALACNIRPNAILMAPLLLCFGLLRSMGAAALFLAIAGSIAAVCYGILVRIYPGYSLAVFSQALNNYFLLYVIGPGSDNNNNAAYGAVKILYHLLLLEMSPDVLAVINKSLLVCSVGLIAFACYRFWRGRLPIYYFAFALTLLYILGSTIFYTYHLLVLYVFILLAGGKALKNGSYPPLLVFMTVAVIVPKNYLYVFPNVSIEGLINPLILVCCLVWILMTKFPVDPPLQLAPEKASTDTPLEKKRRRPGH